MKPTFSDEVGRYSLFSSQTLFKINSYKLCEVPQPDFIEFLIDVRIQCHNLQLWKLQILKLEIHK